jgi:ubiquinone/menaquinone biosynthesis C-methylase UbiE
MQATMTRQKGYKGVGMEGFIARWYTKTRGSASQIAGWRAQAAEMARDLRDGADILEVAPGPGYFAIELARVGKFHIIGLDISRTFIDIATENARQAGVDAKFQQGDVSRMPFADEAFDLVVCQAAFKNFSRPEAAIAEMYRTLRPGGTALIQDMNKDASNAAIRAEVDGMHLGPVRAFMTRGTLGSLRKRAYSRDAFARLVAASPFGSCRITTEGIAIDIRMTKPAAAADANTRTEKT